MILLVALSSFAARAQVNVYTRSNDNARTGQNLQETVLTPANVNAASFGKLFTVHTDGQIFAQPLYVSNLAIAGGTHNVVFLASMLNTVYALDADTGTALWTQNFGSPIIPQDVESDGNIVWQTRIGILGTPVIDPATDIMYFVSGSQPADGSLVFAFNLNAIDIKTGLPVNGSPVKISATYSTADLTTPLVFNARIHNQRPGLALGNGNVYIAFASHEDQFAYHGFVLAYSAATLAQTAVYSDTTIGYQGGIWSAGQAPSIDASGNVYISTGNGSFGPTPNNLVQTGNSFIKLSPTLQLLDYFTPSNSAVLNSGDQDLGSSGLVLIPNTTYAIGGGKQGVLYVVNTTGMGGFNTSADQVTQEFQAVFGKGTSHIHGGPVYFNSDVNGPTIYNWGENDVLRANAFNGTTVNPQSIAIGKLTAPVTNNDGAMPGGFLAISASGNTNGILWASTPYNGDAVHQSVQGVVYAYNADTLDLLWSDKDNDARDEIGTFAKYVPPVVANGKVYMATFGAVGTNDGSGALVVYGLLKPQLTVAVSNASSKTGAALPAFTGTVTGLQNGDTLGTTVIVTYSTTATAASPAGTYPVTATVTGSSAANYQVVVNAGTLTITAPPVLTVTASNATRAFGAANPAFTGTITGAANGDTFTETFTTTATATSHVGSYPIVPAATGANLANYAVTPVNGTLTVTAAATTTTLMAPGSALPAANTTLTATVASTGGTPAGAVTFLSGTTLLGMAPLNASGVAALATTALPTGTDVVTAAYSAAGDYAASTSAAANIIVSPGSQTITFAPIGAHVYGSAPFAATASSSLGSAYPVTITVQSGPAALSGGLVTTTGVGNVVLLATQAGDASHGSANATQTFAVTPAATTTTLMAPASALPAANTTLTATVASTTGTPAGTVTFLSGTTALGTAPLNASGMATLTTATLPTGTDALTAAYAAAGNYAASTSAAANIVVSPGPQTINFAPIGAHVYGSAPFTVAASSSLGSAYPVTITVQSGPAAVSGGLVTTTGVGNVVLLATQAGDASHSAANATQMFAVTPAATTTTLTAPATATSGAAVNLTATVASTAGAVAGTVTFTSGTTTLGTGTLAGGVATLSVASLSSGADVITAAFTASGNFAASTSNAVTVTVAVLLPASYNVAASPTALTIAQGSTGKTMLTFTASGGYNGTIALSCTNLPTNASCAFDQSQISIGDKAQTVTTGLTIKTTAQQSLVRNSMPPGLLALAFWCPGGLTGLTVFLRRRRTGAAQRMALLSLLMLGTFALAVGLGGCGGGSMGSTSQVTLVATGTSGANVTTKMVTLSLTTTH